MHTHARTHAHIGRSLTSLLAQAAKGDEAARVAGARCLVPALMAYGHMMLVRI